MKITQELFNAAFNNGSVSSPLDCEQIANLAANRLGLDITSKQAEEIWEWWSGRACAGWLYVNDDDEVVRAITAFVEYRLGSLLKED